MTWYKMRWYLAASAAALVAPGLAGAAQAQVATDNAGAQPDQTRPQSGSATEDIVVTARKREENIQNVPVAVTALTAQALREKNISNPYDLSQNAPGLDVRAGNSNRNGVDFSIRGQGSTFGSAPGVVAYFMEAPQPVYRESGIGANVQFFDLASIQVLKGPQGTLFGRSSTGGAVLLTPQKPTDDFGGFFQLGLGNYQSREYLGALNVPIVPDVLSVRFAGDVVRRDGFTTSLNTGQKLDDKHRESYRLGILFNPTPWLENYLVLQHNHVNEAASGNVLIDFNPNIPQFNTGPTGAGRFAATALCGGAANTGCIAERTGRIDALYAALTGEYDRVHNGGDDAKRFNQTSAPTFVRNTTQFITNVTTINLGELPVLGDVSAKNIFSTFRVRDAGSRREIGGSPLPHAVIIGGADNFGDLAVYKDYVYDTDFLDDYSEEFQVSGRINQKHDWIVGFFQEQTKTDVQYNAHVLPFNKAFSIPLGADSYNPGLILDPRVKNVGIFGQFTADLDALVEGLRFTAGYRHTTFKLRRTNATSIITPEGIKPNVIPEPTIGSQSAPSYNFTIDYKAMPDVLLYLAHRRSFKQGGFNVVGNSDVPGIVPAYAPEVVKDLEAGVKSKWSIGSIRGRTNIAGYMQWYTGVQRSQTLINPNPPFNTITQTANIAGARIDGFEVENQIDLTSKLTMRLSYSYTHARYSEYPGTTRDYSGAVHQKSDTPFTGVPKYQLAIGARYEMVSTPTLGDIVLSGDYYRQGTVFLDDAALESPNPVGRQVPWDNVNLRLDWFNVAGASFDGAVFVRNLTDDVHLVGVGSLISGLGVTTGLYSEPRTWGVEMRFRF